MWSVWGFSRTLIWWKNGKESPFIKKKKTIHTIGDTLHKLDTMQDLEQFIGEKLIRCESKQTMKQNAVCVSQRKFISDSCF